MTVEYIRCKIGSCESGVLIINAVNPQFIKNGAPVCVQDSKGYYYKIGRAESGNFNCAKVNYYEPNLDRPFTDIACTTPLWGRYHLNRKDYRKPQLTPNNFVFVATQI